MEVDEALYNRQLGEEINILIICPTYASLKKVADAVVDRLENETRAYICKVHQAANLKEVVNCTGNSLVTHFDFVVFIAEGSYLLALDEIDENLQLLSNFLRSKIIMVALDCNFGTALDPKLIWSFVTLHQINLLFGSLKEDWRLNHLCDRILINMEKVCLPVAGIALPCII